MTKQINEDKYLYKTFRLPKHGFFIDIGAGNGLAGSNSRFFENLGWSGICIEPNPIDFQKCKKLRKMTLNIAVSSKEGKQKFYLHKTIPSLSGLKIHNENYKEIEVNCLRLDTIIKDYNVNRIDLLSIDTEGTELDILKSFNILKIKPKIIIVEFKTRGERNIELRKYMDSLSQYYKLEKKLGANLIYVLKGSFKKK